MKITNSSSTVFSILLSLRAPSLWIWVQLSFSQISLLLSFFASRMPRTSEERRSSKRFQHCSRLALAKAGRQAGRLSLPYARPASRGRPRASSRASRRFPFHFRGTPRSLSALHSFGCDVVVESPLTQTDRQQA